MSRRKINWFDRGRDAFAEGCACEIRDGRISGRDRQAWYDGWHRQRELNAAPVAAELVDEWNAFWGAVKQALENN